MGEAQEAEDRGKKSDVRSRRAEVGKRQKSEVRCQTSGKDRSRKSDVRGRGLNCWMNG